MKKTIRTMGRKKNMRFVVPPFVAFVFVCAALGAAPSSSLMTHMVKEMIDDYCSRLEHIDQNPRLAWYTNVEHSVSLLSNSVAEARMLSYWAERAMAIDFSMLKYKDQRRVFEIDIGGCSAARPTFPLKVVENVTVPIAVCILGDDRGPMRTESEIRGMLSKINDIFEQVGMSFYINSLVVSNIHNACSPMFYATANGGHWGFDDVANILPDVGGLKCYFIDSFADANWTIGANSANGMLLTRRADARTWAHEIGHACGLEDVYYDEDAAVISVTASFEWRHALQDWNNGSSGQQTKGSRYYRHGLTQREAIRRLLMYGYNAETSLDITSGTVEGVLEVSQGVYDIGDASTGVFASGGIRSPVHIRKERQND